ncbi:unnamed protein product [Lampetra fluviatilis]
MLDGAPLHASVIPERRSGVRCAHEGAVSARCVCPLCLPAVSIRCVRPLCLPAVPVPGTRAPLALGEALLSRAQLGPPEVAFLTFQRANPALSITRRCRCRAKGRPCSAKAQRRKFPSRRYGDVREGPPRSATPAQSGKAAHCLMEVADGKRTSGHRSCGKTSPPPLVPAHEKTERCGPRKAAAILPDGRDRIPAKMDLSLRELKLQEEEASLR